MIAVVVGVPGVGKTTVIREALKRVKVREINYGDIFLEVAKDVYGVKDRDELREKLTPVEYRVLHEKASERIKELAREPILLDTHALVYTPTGFMPGFPKFVLERLPITLFVIVEADPEEVEARRKRDPRRRGLGLEKDVRLHQELNRIAVLTYAVEKGASVYIIKNREGRQEEAGKELAEVLEQWIRGLSSQR